MARTSEPFQQIRFAGCTGTNSAAATSSGFLLSRRSTVIPPKRDTRRTPYATLFCSIAPQHPMSRSRALFDVCAGLLLGALALLYAASYGALLFTGPLAPHVSMAVGACLFSAFVLGGLLLFMGLGILERWLASWHERLPLLDRALIVHDPAGRGLGGVPERRRGRFAGRRRTAARGARRRAVDLEAAGLSVLRMGALARRTHPGRTRGASAHALDHARYEARHRARQLALLSFARLGRKAAARQIGILVSGGPAGAAQRLAAENVEPSLYELEFEADVLARWFLLGVCGLSNGIAPSTHGTYRGRRSPTLTPISLKAAGPLALVAP
jgi:hypothetical protein